MAKYRRFVAYVYEYHKGKKANNCGFIKVEAKEGRCRMEVHLQCPGLAPDRACDIYGFVRKDGMLNGIWIGTCYTQENMVECTAETDQNHIGGLDVSLRDLAGVIIETDSGAFFGTEWDDEAIKPENFRKYQDSEESIYPEEETQKAPEEVPEEETLEEASEEGIPEEEEIPEEETPEEEIPEEETPEKEAPKEEVLKEEVPEEKTLEEVSEKVTAEETMQKDIPEMDEKRSREREAREKKNWPGESCELFDDGEIVRCWKIQPQDFVHFHKRDWVLRNNRFLLYGYYNFGHILLCRKADGGYLLGVPGGYDQQERFMAGMFGFPCFKESRSIRLKKGRGGYWYRSINAPDFNQRDSLEKD